MPRAGKKRVRSPVPTECSNVDKQPYWSSVILSSIAKGVERLQAARPTAERLERLVATSSKAKKYLTELSAAQKRLCELMAEPAFEEVVSTNRAGLLLANWPGNALRAFWEAMKEGDSTEVAVAIVMDPSCGLEKKARNLRDIVQLRNFYRMLPLDLAVRANRADVVIALLDAGAKLYSEKDYSSLSKACKSGDLESFKALIAAGATIEEDMMYDAARGGNADIIKLLAAKGISVRDDQSFYAESPIHVAAKKGHTAAVEAILDLGEYVDAMTRERDTRSTALTLAVANGHIETVKVLVARGARINEAPRWVSALDEAVQRDNMAMVRTLLALGADAKRDRGYRDGHVVYSCNYVKSVEMAKLLTTHGAVIKEKHLCYQFLPKPVLEYYREQIKLTEHR